MPSSTISLHWREMNVLTSVKKSVAVSLVMDIVNYLVELPFVAVGALWIICFPLMYFALYGDLVQSAGTLAGMTLIFLMFLMVFMAIVVSACLVVSYIAHFVTRARWRKFDSRS